MFLLHLTDHLHPSQTVFISISQIDLVGSGLVAGGVGVLGLYTI